MTIRLLIGDCREMLKTMPNESVHCVVTSPPYFGLRDYGTAQWEGGDSECNHAGTRSVGKSTLKNDGRENPGVLENHKVPDVPYKQVCRDCGARRIDSQIGLEQTPQDYVTQIVAIFRELRRVLRSDGTLWLNLGDSYAAAGYSNHDNTGGAQVEHGGKQRHLNGTGLKPKDLCGIPWRVAFALQADGWYLRQDIIWSKPNPMPESVTDRCTKAHEYIFLMSKSSRYFYDAEAIAEPVNPSQVGRVRDDVIGGSSWKERGQHSIGARYSSGNIKRKDATERGCPASGVDGSIPWEGTTRNKRSVWEITTAPFPEAHFATFPPALIEPCILAGCPTGGTVLDPFAGAGTTGLVADRLRRHAILIELNREYAAMAERRIADDAGMFAEFECEI